jgi:aminomethyltransferase
MKRTPLYEQHVRDASAVINLKGFARAMQYAGHVREHRATREAVTLCDVSHMGEFDFQGPHALALVQKLITNDAAKLAVDQALYSTMCDERGIVIDDLVCFRLAPDRFVWVVNVTKTDDDYQWVLKHAHGLDVTVRNVSTDTALMALQGPASREVLQRICKADLKPLQYYRLAQTVLHTHHAEAPCMVSRTGYTGELGYEIMVARDLAPWVWDELLMAGRPLGIVPHGVAARESLRTEAGYLLNGNDMDAKTNPFEAGLGWVVKLSKGDFIGRDALARMQASGVARKMVGLEVAGVTTIRNGYRICRNGRDVGFVTSGPLSASLTGRNCGLGYVATAEAAIGTELEVDIRGKRAKAKVVAMPFCKRRVKDEPTVDTWSPYELRFSEHHMWARMDDDANHDGAKDVVAIGLTDFGQRALGDVLSLQLPKAGDRIEAGAPMGWGDSYRRAFELVAPVSGKVVAVDAQAERDPARLNAYPYGRKGIVEVRLDESRAYGALMNFSDYAEHVRNVSRYDAWTGEKRMT